MTNKLYKIQDAAQELKVSRQTVYNWISKAKIWTITIGGVVFIPESEINRLRK